MARPSSHPILYDAVKVVSITQLKAWGYLQPNRLKNATITWGRDGSTISISINTARENQYVELRYRYNERTVKYKVNLVSIPSNLGVGRIPLFLCPKTKRRCRKLFFVKGKFLHRTAVRHGMYDIQTLSHKDRRAIKDIKAAVIDRDKAYEQLYKKYFKVRYNGRHTNRYLRLMKVIKESDKFTLSDIERLYLR